MAKGDIYYLIDQNGYTVAKFELTDDYMTGNCYTCCTWAEDNAPIDYQFFVKVFCKADSCTHWLFKGEDFDEETNTNDDSYYHICGSLCFGSHVQVMCFIWKVAAMVLVKENPEYKTYIEQNYFRNEKMKKLAELFLEGCTIKEELKNGET